jgi:hypothetical protein
MGPKFPSCAHMATKRSRQWLYEDSESELKHETAFVWFAR